LILFQDERRERKRYRAVVTQASEGIFQLTRIPNASEANAAFQNLLGYTSEVLGLTLYDVVLDNCDSIDHNVQDIRTKDTASLANGNTAVRMVPWWMLRSV